ncbi:LysR family transcriptional regulator [Rugamonas sp. CCM 8940]|uniref:LysR family transcriptional regulator n=1 Tax=Rugamonas sp. CCM 8940 TaxID=2765359 RepID=UPI0018F5DC17|nr:LysR family transcriptional regulator [Rugamonas sp. CCM 8940]MBJ7313558.1 LysR family transcriptional regulator [Rugamonas sp. CCM 8940]
MTLEQLRIFVEVAQRQHLTQAASALALTPSAVSASLRVLEERYATPLFNRVGRRIELNEAGQLFLAGARATLASARAAELTLQELGGLQRGVLHIQASQTIASYWLPALLVRFREKYPQIELGLAIGNTRQVAQALVDGAADLGLVEGLIDEPTLVATTVGQDSLIVVVAPDHPWAAAGPLRMADLLNGRWILREPGSGTRSAFEHELRQAGVDPAALDVVLALPSNEAVRSAVLAGPFATVVSELVVASQLRAGSLHKVELTFPARAFHLLRHVARYKSKASLAFVKMLDPADPSRVG